MIRSRVFGTITGSNIIIHPSIARVRMLGVEREGTGMKIVSALTTPTGNEVSYIGVGRLTFDVTIPFQPGERVWVLYET